LAQTSLKRVFSTEEVLEAIQKRWKRSATANTGALNAGMRCTSPSPYEVGRGVG
jgi:hypothetical protein